MSDLDKFNFFLNELDTVTDKLDFSTVRKKLDDFSKENPEITELPEFVAEILAFSFWTHDGYNESPWGTYHIPMMSFKNEDGQFFEYPSLQKLTSEIVNIWEQRKESSKHPILKIRYSDLLWDLKFKVTGERADISFAHQAIDSTIELTKKNLYLTPVFTKTILKRALTLSLSTNYNKGTTPLIREILNFEDQISEDSKAGLWGFNYDFLMTEKKIKKLLSEEQKKKIIDDLEARLLKVGKLKNLFLTERATLLLADFYSKNNKPDDVKRVFDIHIETVLKQCEKGSAIQASSWLQSLNDILRKYSLIEEAIEIEKLIAEESKKINNELKEISSSVEVSDQQLNDFLDALIKDNFKESIYRISAYFFPKKDKVENQLRDLAQKSPVSFLVSRQLLDKDGRPVTSLGNLEEDLEGNIANQMSQNMSMGSFFLSKSFDRLQEKFDVSETELGNLLYESPLFTENSKSLISLGLKNYFNQNFTEAIHLLIPQIEASVRNLLEMVGRSVLKKNRSGGFHYKTFDEILRDDLLAPKFGDMFFYLRVLFTDPKGWNLRNNVCHGITPKGNFCKEVTERVIHALICLSSIRVKEE